MLAAGVLLAVIRVVSGVHFPRDVVVGALLGMLAGFVGLWIL
ncbi:phosphatase PAP2 family protein [uncultured Senegalimassilia sp.]